MKAIQKVLAFTVYLRLQVCLRRVTNLLWWKMTQCNLEN